MKSDVGDCRSVTPLAKYAESEVNVGADVAGTVLLLLLEDARVDHCKAVKFYNNLIHGLHWVLRLETNHITRVLNCEQSLG